ncbi:MAG TPA: ABC transporter permease [Bacteroidota bacterium]|jgi:ABC-2 type transport system permease protein|nr:ABC transporter permease [Bacteroidota bacterium]
MNKMFAVARWEYVEKIKSKAFLVSIVLIPLIMLGLGIVPGMLASRSDTETRTIGVFDQTGNLLKPLQSYLDKRYRLADNRPNYRLVAVADTVNSTVEGKNLADALVMADKIEGYVIIPKSIMSDSSVEYRSENVGNVRITDRLTTGIRDLVVQRKLHERGIDPRFARELTSPFEMRTIKLSKTGEEESGFAQIFFTAYIFMMMLMFLVMTSGQLLVRSMLEEKSNRVIEVLVSSCSPKDLMAGKILGLSGLGLTQMGIWAMIGVAISLKFGIAMIPLSSAVLLFIYYVLGYLFYAGMFVAVGAPVSTEQEAQQITSYLTIILVLPIALAVPVMQNPNSLLVKVLSYIPLLTPTMMAIRIPINMPSPVEILTTIAILTASAIAVIWAAGKIFRVAILIYGKRPSIPEFLRILRS